MGSRRAWLGIGQHLLLAATVAAALPFVVYALEFGWAGLTLRLDAPTYLFAEGAWLSNGTIFVHMLAGAAITVLAPLQLAGAIRRRWTGLHRAAGHLLAAGAILAGLGGGLYIALRGTIGGPLMDAGFAGYGACLVLAAAQTLRHGRAGNRAQHRDWALRLFWLALGSWLYRVHYGVWYAATGGLWSAEDFSGAFDRVTAFAFYLPYLAAVELYLRRKRRRAMAQPA